MIPRSEQVAEDEITRIAGLPVTTRVRTAFDLGRHLDRPQALARMDALMWNQKFSREPCWRWRSDTHAPAACVSFVNCFHLSTAARSLHARARLGCGCTTRDFRAPRRRYPYWPGLRALSRGSIWVGGTSWSRSNTTGTITAKIAGNTCKDIARLRMLEALGWKVIRVIAEDHPHDWLARVEAALIDRGGSIAA